MKRALVVRKESSPPTTRRGWAALIVAEWRGSVAGIFRTGRALIAAKGFLPHGSFEGMLARDLPFQARTAQMLMHVAADARLAKPNHGTLLPPHWRTLYEISTLDDDDFKARIADGTIHPDMERADLLKFRNEARHGERLAEMRALADTPLALPIGPFGAGVADPPWEDEDAPIGFSPRHYRSHYATMRTEAIAALPVAALFTPTAFLALWITRHMLALGAHLPVLAAWEFEPRTIWTWDKEWPALGNGYLRDRSEHLVLAVRGKPPVPISAKLRPNSIFAQRRSARHSQKPVHPQEWIEQWFPAMSYIELFARGDSRPGWTAWGHEVSTDVAPQIRRIA